MAASASNARLLSLAATALRPPPAFLMSGGAMNSASASAIAPHASKTSCRTRASNSKSKGRSKYCPGWQCELDFSTPEVSPDSCSGDASVKHHNHHDSFCCAAWSCTRKFLPHVQGGKHVQSSPWQLVPGSLVQTPQICLPRCELSQMSMAAQAAA